MEGRPLISFIVPVYNSERYIDKCINSILNQTVGDFEIIIIDDGSKDNSFKKCKKYQNENENVKVFSQRNQGVSVARNNGLKNSKGEWIAFVDVDDQIAPNYIESVLYYINEKKYDLIQFDFFINEKEYEIKNIESNYTVYGKNEAMELVEATFSNKRNNLNCENIILRSPCTKVYKKEFIENEKINFIPNLKMGEDFIFNINVYLKMKKMCYIKKGLYKVEARSDSASRGYIHNMDEVDKLFYDKLKEVFIKHKITKSIWDLYYEEAFVGIMRCMKYQYFNKKCEMDYKTISDRMNKLVKIEPYNRAIEITKKEKSLNKKIVAWLLDLKFFYVLKIIYTLKRQ